jgi:type VII secretion effector (TIGR04197 family)
VSSPLDGRIRAIAREEASTLLGVPNGVQAADESEPTAGQLQEQITDLHEHLHQAAATITRLDARLDVLEKAARQADQEERPTARRATRKASGTAASSE